MNLGDFMSIKKMRDVRTIISAAESRRDLCYVSENKGFRVHQRGKLMETFPWTPSPA